MQQSFCNFPFDTAQIAKAVTALYSYLAEQKSNTNKLWVDEKDINLIFEPKIRDFKAHTFHSIRIPLAHSFRKDDFHEICIIARSKDVQKWREILFNKHPIRNLTKIIGIGDFLKEYHTQESRLHLVNFYDLFIIHPAIAAKMSKKLVCFLKTRNKACAILPTAHPLLYNLGPVENHLKPKLKKSNFSAIDYQINCRKFAEMIADFRDSTYFMNFYLPQKFVKVGQTSMNATMIKENISSVLKYLPPMLNSGGFLNIMRVSLNLNQSAIQLPFYIGSLDAKLQRNWFTMDAGVIDKWNINEFEEEEEKIEQKEHFLRIKKIENEMFSKNPRFKKQLVCEIPMKNLHSMNIKQFQRV